MKEVKIEISPTGRVAMLYDDAIDLSDLGEVRVSRASYVEPFHGDVLGVTWSIRSAKTDDYVGTGFSTRSDALKFEKAFYSPGSIGWPELT